MASSLEPRIVEAPGRGLVRNVDPRHVPENAWSAGRNIRFPTGGSRVRKTDGYQRVDSTILNQPIRGLWWYVDPYGVMPSALVRIGTVHAFQGIGGTSSAFAQFSDRTQDDVVTIDQYEDRLIWADGKSVMTWNGTGLAEVLGGGAPTAKLVEIHKEHVLLGNWTTPVAPWAVQYSAPGNPLDYTADNAGDQLFLDDSTGLTALKVLGDHCIVHKPSRLYRMIFVGPPEQYIVESIPADEGSISARGPISVGSYQYYPGHTNIFRLGSFSEPIGDAIWPEVAAAIDWRRAYLTYAYRRDQWDEICWKFPARGAEQPNLTVIFNYRDQTWTATDHDPGTSYTQVPSDALPSTFFDDAASPVSPPPVRDVFGQFDGRIQVYMGRNADGQPIHAWVESRHATDQLVPVKILAVPMFATGTGTLIVQLRAAMEARHPLPPWPATPHSSATFQLPSSQTRPWVDVRAYGRIWQIRLDSNQVGDDWEVSAYGTAVIPGGFAR